MSLTITVAISADFFDAFSRLPNHIQGKTSRTVTEFRRDPTSRALNYEKIVNGHPDMHSIRIDLNYRAIVLKPRKGNVYLLLWVDKHDEAYTWASRHKVQVNPETGSIQVFEVHKGIKEVVVPVYVPQEVASKPFDRYDAQALMRLGVPEEQVAMVQDLVDEESLEAALPQLTREGYEGLFLLLCGTDYNKIIAEREVRLDRKVDPDDFESALDKPYSRASFAVFTDDHHLNEMLTAPLDKWRVYLHPSQVRLANGSRSGPTRVLGGAGTGKTVVAMHRAKWLAEHVATSEKKVLFTTFTRNLATDIEGLLRKICGPELMKRIEVINLDRWMSGYLHKMNHSSEILYDNSLQKKLWAEALSNKSLDPAIEMLNDQFYKEEWERVVQLEDVTSLEHYKRVPRLGRGTRLNRQQRIAVWRVLDEYRIQLGMNRKIEVDDAYRDVAAHLRSKTILEDTDSFPYAAIVVDEAQDMSVQAYRLLRAMVPERANDLFIVGDAHQRIYSRNKVVLSNCGIKIVGRAFKLRLNYRTTEEIRREAVRLLEGRPIDDLDGGYDNNDGYKSLTHGEAPEMWHYPDANAHDQAVVTYLQALEAVDDEDPNKCGHAQVCIVARTSEPLNRLALVLAQAKMLYRILGKDEKETQVEGGVRLATMHRVKGLEFKNVLMIDINEDQLPLAYAMDRSDAVSTEQAETEERALAYVAMTRARFHVRLQCHGKPSRFFAWPAQDEP